MMLKKFYGSSIQEARSNARQVLGPSFIVVETKEALNGERAWIHVMDDNRSQNSPQPASPTPTAELLPKAFNKIKETFTEGMQLLNGSTNGAETHKSSTNGVRSQQKRQATYKRSSMLSRPKHMEKFSLESAGQPKLESKVLLSKLNALSQRFEHIETLLANGMMGVNVQMVSHPAFQQLLASGVPHPIISRWFNALMESGINPYNQQGDFIQELAGKVKQSLDVASYSKPAKFMIFSGAHGAGKSSLMMSLALHPTLLKSDSCALVSVCSTITTNRFSPLSAFACEHEIPHYKIEDKSTLAKLKEERSNFDYILIELPQKTDLVTMQDVAGMIPHGESLEVHRVINAAINTDYLNSTETLKQHTAPDYIDFTHLDQLPKKGSLLPILEQTNGPVRYVTNSPHITGAVSQFQPAAFAKQLLTR